MRPLLWTRTMRSIPAITALGRRTILVGGKPTKVIIRYSRHGNVVGVKRIGDQFGIILKRLDPFEMIDILD